MHKKLSHDAVYQRQAVAAVIVYHTCTMDTTCTCIRLSGRLSEWMDIHSPDCRHYNKQ